MRKLAPLTDLGKALLYFVIAFGLCLALAVLAPWIGRRTPDIAMFTPLTAVSLMLFVFTRDGYSQRGWRALGLHRAGMARWGLALGVPLTALGFAYGTIWIDRSRCMLRISPTYHCERVALGNRAQRF